MAKKAQIKMMETVFVVIIFMVIMIGAFFYFIQSKADSFEKEARQQTVKETISRVSVISGLSEIACSSAGDVLSNCIDKSKLSFFDPTSNTGFYYDYLGDTDILIEQIYPPLTTTVNHAPVTAYFFEDTVGYLCNATKPKPTSSVTDGNLHF